MSQEVDTLGPRAEALLALATQLQSQCREQSERTAVLVAQLRGEAHGLHRLDDEAQQDMSEMKQHLDELWDTKMAFDAKERQARKLSRQF